MDKDKILFLADVLEKTAAYIDQLETQLEEKQAKINETVVEKQAGVVDQLSKIGFTKEEIQAISALPEATMTKVAGMVKEAEPWEIGHGVGVKREKTDPFLEWLLT